MKHFIAIVASAITLVPSVSMADGGRHWRAPDRYSDHYDRGSRINPWPFIAGAVVGGIIVHAAEADEPQVITSKPAEKPVLVNGIWMQRTYQCVQDIVTDRYGNEQLMNRCNWVFVPVQVQPPPSN